MQYFSFQVIMEVQNDLVKPPARPRHFNTLKHYFEIVINKCSHQFTLYVMWACDQDLLILALKKTPVSFSSFHPHSPSMELCHFQEESLHQMLTNSVCQVMCNSCISANSLAQTALRGCLFQVMEPLMNQSSSHSVSVMV